ncbi:MAG: hypothetical protein IIY89_03355 [Clostridia bacterium]|nr:hypothetical protein [Clostridia bacterium]
MDIIGLPHHKAVNRKPMSLYDRAAQFAPFAALVGYDEMITEVARLTDSETTLTEGDIEVLNRKLSLILEMVEEKQHPEITVVYFEPDVRKDGGSFLQAQGIVKAIDPIEGRLIFYAANGISNGQVISLSRVRRIQGESVDFWEE